uniref:AlNc14C4G548 protein n=1 Tax=Albugo laibachii Nc14 TaxID=890382 RepID=F0W0A6_9STRA|nr:AlNc14C4G548 [Albugo laibachii Nc14]|eukprot:CCA14477.1 AlNc14C4G548 [Albugo laibachii Nc14]
MKMETQAPAAGEVPKLDTLEPLNIKQAEEMTNFHTDEPVRKKKLTSVVWETFTPISSSGLRDGVIDAAKCNLCHKTFSTRHGTSSMMRHAKRHAEIAATLSETAGANRRHKRHNSNTQSNLTDKKMIIGPQHRKDKTSHGSMSYETESVGGIKRQKLRNLNGALIDWMIHDGQDATLLQCDNFLDIFTAIGINPTFPSVEMYSKIVERRYFASFHRMTEYLSRSTTGRIVFSCDTWSGLTDKDYMGIYIYWINADWEYKTMQIGLEAYPSTGNPYFLSDLLYYLLQNQWGIGNQLLCGVLPVCDEASVGMGFLREKIKLLIGTDSIALNWNITCLGHLIHVGMLEGLGEIEPEILKLRSLLSLLQALMETHEYLSIKATDMVLPQIADQYQLPNLDTPIHWRSTIAMILNSFKVKDTINTLYGDTSNGMNLFLLDEIEWDLLYWTATFFQKCIQMATCQSDQKHISLSTSLNVCKAIINLCESTASAAMEFPDEVCTKIQAVCVKVKVSLESYQTNTSSFFTLAKILDPRFSNESIDKAEKKDFLREMLHKNVHDTLSNSHAHTHTERQETSSAYSTFDKLLDIGEGMPDYTMDGDEVDRFFDATLIRDKRSDPFLWWKSNETRFPNLAKLARDILSIPATAIPSGAIFTQAAKSRVIGSPSTAGERSRTFKYAALERAWQLERQPIGGKRRQDAFPFQEVGELDVSAALETNVAVNPVHSTPMQSTPGKVTYEESI